MRFHTSLVFVTYIPYMVAIYKALLGYSERAILHSGSNMTATNCASYKLSNQLLFLWNKFVYWYTIKDFKD